MRKIPLTKPEQIYAALQNNGSLPRIETNEHGTLTRVTIGNLVIEGDYSGPKLFVLNPYTAGTRYWLAYEHELFGSRIQWHEDEGKARDAIDKIEELGDGAAFHLVEVEVALTADDEIDGVTEIVRTIRASSDEAKGMTPEIDEVAARRLHPDKQLGF